jgi:multiple sugar transport system substrate-binding protein
VILLAIIAFTPIPAASVTLEFWGGWTGSDGDAVREIVKDWNAKNPDVQVNLTIQQWSPLYDAFLVAASGKKSPDLLATHTPELAQFIEKGLLLPLESILAATKINPGNYAPNVWEANSYKGKLYGVPLDFHMYGLFYNVDLVKKAGVTIPKEPMNAEQFLKVLRALTLDKNGKHPGEAGFDPANIVQYGVNQHTNHHAFYQWWGLYNQLGGALIADDGKKCVLNIDNAAKAWTWLQDLVYKYNVAPQGQTDYPRDFMSGRTAMMISGPWERLAFVVANKEKGFNWSVAPYPVIFGKRAVWGYGHAFTIPTYGDPAKRAASIKFIEWFAASPRWAKTGQVPVFKGMTESAEFKAIPGWEVFAEQLPYEKMLQASTKFNDIYSSSAPTPMMVLGQNIILKKADPRAESQKACETITGILSIP